MIDQQQFAPPWRLDEREEVAATPSAPPTREQISAIAAEVSSKLGAVTPEVLSCLTARLSDAKSWLTVTGANDARIWLVIVRAPVGVPRPSGGVFKTQRLEIAIDATNGRPLGFRLAN